MSKPRLLNISDAVFFYPGTLRCGTARKAWPGTGYVAEMVPGTAEKSAHPFATLAEAERFCAESTGPFLLGVLAEHGRFLGLSEAQVDALRALVRLPPSR
jgi:hypothetical protein